MTALDRLAFPRSRTLLLVLSNAFVPENITNRGAGSVLVAARVCSVSEEKHPALYIILRSPKAAQDPSHPICIVATLVEYFLPPMRSIHNGLVRLEVDIRLFSPFRRRHDSHAETLPAG